MVGLVEGLRTGIRAVLAVEIQVLAHLSSSDVWLFLVRPQEQLEVHVRKRIVFGSSNGIHPAVTATLQQGSRNRNHRLAYRVLSNSRTDGVEGTLQHSARAPSCSTAIVV